MTLEDKLLDRLEKLVKQVHTLEMESKFKESRILMLRQSLEELEEKHRQLGATHDEHRDKCVEIEKKLRAEELKNNEACKYIQHLQAKLKARKKGK